MKILVLRRLCQLATVALFCVLPWICAMEIDVVQGTLFSFNLFGIPFADPVAAVQSLPCHGEVLLGAGMSFLLAFLLGRFFCGWLCPYGLVSELVFDLRRLLGHCLGGTSGPRVLLAERLTRLVVFLVGAFCVFALGYPLLNIISFPGNLSLVPLLYRLQAGFAGFASALALPVVAIAVEAVLGRRVWCRHACPQALLLGCVAFLASRLPLGWRIGWNGRRCSCKGVTPCRNACSLGLNPRTIEGPSRFDCTMCGDCIRACRRKGGGALHWQWGCARHGHAGHDEAQAGEASVQADTAGKA